MNYELTHDILAQKIWERLSVEDKQKRRVLKFLNTRYDNYVDREQSPKALLDREELDYIQSFESRLSLDKKLADFINKSRGQARRQRLIQWIIVGGIGTIIIGFGIIAIFLYLNLLSEQYDKFLKQAQNQQSKAQYEEAIGSYKEALRLGGQDARGSIQKQLAFCQDQLDNKEDFEMLMQQGSDSAALSTYEGLVAAKQAYGKAAQLDYDSITVRVKQNELDKKIAPLVEDYKAKATKFWDNREKDFACIFLRRVITLRPNEADALSKIKAYSCQ